MEFLFIINPAGLLLFRKFFVEHPLATQVNECVNLASTFVAFSTMARQRSYLIEQTSKFRLSRVATDA
jgi:hypothetical protein